jgi:hypothetical protein
MKEHDSSPLNDFIEYTPEEMLRRHSIRSLSERHFHGTE